MWKAIGLILGIAIPAFLFIARKGIEDNGEDDPEWKEFLERNKSTHDFKWTVKVRDDKGAIIGTEVMSVPDFPFNITMGLPRKTYKLPKLEGPLLMSENMSMTERLKYVEDNRPWKWTKHNILAYIENYVVPELRGLVYAIITHESRFKIYAKNVNKDGSKDLGLAQINENTARFKGWKSSAAKAVQKEGLYNLYDPEFNIELAEEMLGVWAKTFGEGGKSLAGILRRYGGGVQLLTPKSDYQRVLINVASGNDLLG